MRENKIVLSLSVCYREKKQVKCCTWGHEIVSILVTGRVCNNGGIFQSFLYVFCHMAGCCLQWQGVCNSEGKS